MLASWKKSYKKLGQCVKKQRHHLANKGPCGSSSGFPSSHVWIWDLDHKEGWGSKNWCFWTMVLEKTLESPVRSKEIEPVNFKENQSWIFIGRTDAEAEAPTLWPPDGKSQFIRKDPDAGKDGRQEEKGTTEDETVGWHHLLHVHEFKQALGDGEGQGSLACCSPWWRKESDMTERWNNKSTELGREQVLHNYSVSDRRLWTWWAGSWELSFHLFPLGSQLSFLGLL